MSSFVCLMILAEQALFLATSSFSFMFMNTSFFCSMSSISSRSCFASAILVFVSPTSCLISLLSFSKLFWDSSITVSKKASFEFNWYSSNAMSWSSSFVCLMALTEEALLMAISSFSFMLMNTSFFCSMLLISSRSCFASVILVSRSATSFLISLSSFSNLLWDSSISVSKRVTFEFNSYSCFSNSSSKEFWTAGFGWGWGRAGFWSPPKNILLGVYLRFLKYNYKFNKF